MKYSNVPWIEALVADSPGWRWDLEDAIAYYTDTGFKFRNNASEITWESLFLLRTPEAQAAFLETEWAMETVLAAARK